MLYLAGRHVFENESIKMSADGAVPDRLEKTKRQEYLDAALGISRRRLKGWSEKDFETGARPALARRQIEFREGSTPNRGRSGCRYRTC